MNYEISEKNYKSVVKIDSSLIRFVHSWLFKYGLNLVAGIQIKKAANGIMKSGWNWFFLSIRNCEERYSHANVNAVSSKSYFF